jgi:two-component system LytT family response regulator
MAKIRTVIVDDEPLARERIRTLLEAEADIEVVGECRDGDEAVETVRRQTPDLVFLDVQIPERNGFEVLKALGADPPPIAGIQRTRDCTAHPRSPRAPTAVWRSLRR